MVNYLVDGSGTQIVDNSSYYISDKSSVPDLLNRGCASMFRRISMKRLNTDGTYETDWYDISSYVIRYPTVKIRLGDNVLLGDYDIDPFNLILNNAERKFNNESDSDSLFSTFSTRRYTKIKIEAGFIDDDESEVEGFVFYGVLMGDPPADDSGNITFVLSSLLSMFKQFPASGIATSAATTETLITRIYEKQVNSEDVFIKYFEGASINPDSDTVLTVSSPVVRADQTAWKKITDYSTYNNFFPGVNSDGEFTWKSKEATSDIKWYFNGAGSTNVNDYGINIISIQIQDGVKDFYPRVTVEYTDGSFQTESTSWTPGDASEVDKYGDRTLPLQFFELSSSEATTVATIYKTAYGTIKNRYLVNTIFIPLGLTDRIEINYIGSQDDQTLLGDNSGYYIADDSDNVIGDSLSLGPININGDEAKVDGVTYDIERLVCTFDLKEI